MRRVVFSAFIFLLMLIFCIQTLMSIEKVYVELTNQIEEIEYSIKEEKYEQAAEKANIFHKTWHNHEETLVLIIRHQPLDNITVSTAKMISFVENGENAQALAELNSMKTVLYHLFEAEIPYVYNIF